MFPISYPSSKLGYTWQELGCLARSLGYPQECLKTSLPDQIHMNPDKRGLTLKELDKMINSKYYLVCLDHTSNYHSYDWNVAVLQKAAKLVCSRFVSFQELMQIRVAYALYEDRDTKGMKIDQRTLTRCFKMSNRAIAPLKLMHRLKHMKGGFEVRGRIQLGEFLDLVLWSAPQQHVPVHYPETSSATERALFKMTNFDEMFEHHDLKMANILNKAYLKDEYCFDIPVGGVRDRQRVADGIMIDDKMRQSQASANRTSSRTIRPVVRHTERLVQLSESGYLLEARPRSAPELRHLMRAESRAETGQDSRPQTSLTMVETYLPEVLVVWKEDADVTSLTYRPRTADYQRTATPVTVTETERQRADVSRNALVCDQIISKLTRRANEDLEYLRPGILGRLAERRVPSPPPQPEPARTPRTPRPDPAFIRYISTPRQRASTARHSQCYDSLSLRRKGSSTIRRPQSNRA